jgi:hypothetical protein
MFLREYFLKEKKIPAPLSRFFDFLVRVGVRVKDGWG